MIILYQELSVALVPVRDKAAASLGGSSTMDQWCT